MQDWGPQLLRGCLSVPSHSCSALKPLKTPTKGQPESLPTLWQCTWKILASIKNTTNMMRDTAGTMQAGPGLKPGSPPCTYRLLSPFYWVTV